jgi:hypothetical protein
MSNTNNPSAFPSTNHGMIVSTGMGLRDYFAAKASEEDIRANIEGPMQECIVESSDGRKHITHRNVKYTREQAKYRYADTMMKAREA